MQPGQPQEISIKNIQNILLNSNFWMVVYVCDVWVPTYFCPYFPIFLMYKIGQALNYLPQCRGVKVAICFLVYLLQISLSPSDPKKRFKPNKENFWWHNNERQSLYI